MNYRHAFHAGNFADVFKHLILARMLLYLTRKDAPLRFIDTHAGIGSYDLGSDEALRTGEWREGIGRLEAATLPSAIAPLIRPYLDALATHRARMASPGAYPGSPALAAHLLRQQDKLALCELHTDDARTLVQNMRRDRRVNINPIDGYTALRAYIPPVERRGLVFVDPPYEQTSEFEWLAAAITAAWNKWPGGVYCVWYPVKNREQVNRFYEVLIQSGINKMLRLELSVGQPGDDSGLVSNGLVSNGLAIINPPYVLQDEARIILPHLSEILGRDKHAGWLIEEPFTAIV